jgi:hypothetical protein
LRFTPLWCGYLRLVIEHDPRLQTGAYITDGIDLYEVVGLRTRPGNMGIRTVRIVVENCRSFRGLEFLPERIRATFNLVRQPPHPRCPDVVEEIPW